MASLRWIGIKHPKQMGAYAYSKLEAEKLVLNAYYKDGLKATVVRPGIVIGPLAHVFSPTWDTDIEINCSYF
jgi:nucleoside-diphosphate-sugar epimerase